MPELTGLAPSATERPCVIRQRFAVAYDYSVAFTRGCFEADNGTLAEIMAATTMEPRPRCIVLVDLGVLDGRPTLVTEIGKYFAHRTDLPHLAMSPLVLPGGETIKNDAALIGRLHDAIFDNGIDRHSYVVAVGGGAFLDAVGLAASTAHRGVRLIRVPTTVLAQNDSGVGVKSAINRSGAKNQIGTFAPPWAVDPRANGRAQRRALYRLGAGRYSDIALLLAAEGAMSGERLTDLLALARNWIPPVFPLTGHDVTRLGVRPGEKVGDLLDAVQDWWEAGDYSADHTACLARLKELVDSTR